MFVRWDNLRIENEDGHQLPGYRDPAVVRRFDAPEALDIRFYEVHAKSALNHVPKASRMPFRWTINPYRGCTHACTYCMAGDTQILMADGRVKLLADVRPGETIYGTEHHGEYRRLTATEVLDHWSSLKRVHRVVLEDGTELVASGDHRFLTTRGWAHVASSPSVRRPHLSMGSELIGVPRHGEPSICDPVTAHPRLRVVAVEQLDTELELYDITTGSGDFIANGVVSHNCFARPTHTYLDFDAGRDFEREIVVKVNVPEVLRRELARPSWKGEHVALGTNTDPYQWVEGRYKLMPGIWEAFRDFRNPCSVLTKSPLLLRDLPLLKEVAEVAPVSANLSVPTLDEKAWRATEPHTPNPRARLEAVAELNRAGIPTGVLIAPLMPGINDAPEQVEEILDIATEAGAVSVGGIALHLRGEVRGIFFDWLRAQRPDLLPRYEQLYRRGAYMAPAERERLQDLAAPPGRPASPRRYMRDRDLASPPREQPARSPQSSQAALF
ncbi:MAG TPA: radical SAM protein [Thermoleophilaceae bacterium]